MSKKTREEKIVSNYRKKLKFLSQSGKDVPTTEVKQTHDNFSADKTERDRFFVKDLKKSIFIISCILTLEIVLYFVRINR